MPINHDALHDIHSQSSSRYNVPMKYSLHPPHWFFVSLWTVLMILGVVLLGMGIWIGHNFEIMTYRFYWVALLAVIGLVYACFFRAHPKSA